MSRFVWEVMYEGEYSKAERWFSEPQLGSVIRQSFINLTEQYRAKALALTHKTRCEAVQKPIKSQSSVSLNPFIELFI